MEQLSIDKEDSTMSTDASTLDESVDPKRFDEAKTVHEMFNRMDKLVKAGSPWYIISMKWIDKWQKYTFFDYLSSEKGDNISPEDRVIPGEINNSDIL